MEMKESSHALHRARSRISADSERLDLVLPGHQRPARQLHDWADEVGGVWRAMQRSWGRRRACGAADDEEALGESSLESLLPTLLLAL